MPFISRIWNALRRRRINDEIDEELRFHLNQRARELERQGLTVQDAQRAARLRFGNPDLVRERGLDVKVANHFSSILRDAQFGLRLIGKAPFFTSAVVCALSLAIGVNTAVFSLLDTVVLKPLPVEDPESLVFLTFPADSASQSRREIDYFSYPVFRELRDAGRPFVDLFAMAYQGRGQVIFEENPAEPEKLYAQWISGHALPLLGVRAAIGRTLTAADDRAAGAHPVAVISYSLWERRFARDPNIFGRYVRIPDPEERSYEIVGVLQREFTGAEPGILTDIWVPCSMWSTSALRNANSNWLRIWGRMKPGVTKQQAEAVLQPVFTAFRRTYAGGARVGSAPDAFERHINAPLHLRPAANGPSMFRKTYERPLWVLMGVSGLLLLVACTTVANLLLARGAVREREMAVRISIGAGRGRLIQQVLVECAILSLAACVMGCVLARILVPVLVGALDTQLYPVGLPTTLDLRLLTALIGFGLITTFVFGTLPALRVSVSDPNASVKRSMRSSFGRAGTSRWFLVAEVCCCCLIVFFAGLFLRSFQKLSDENLGFDPKGLFVAAVDARDAGVDGPGKAAWHNLRTRIGRLPGVTSVSAATFALFSGSGWTRNVRVEGRPTEAEPVHFLPVAPEYFKTMTIRLVAGRDFTELDLQNQAPRPVIVNAAFAKRYLDGALAAGQRFEAVDHSGATEALTAIGVAANARYDSVRHPAPPTVYVPFPGGASGALLIRSELGPASLASILRKELPRAHPAFRLGEIHAQARLVSDSFARDRALALLSAVIAAAALTLAGLGLYAVLSYAVARRTRELAIRIALGASRPHAVRLLVRDSSVDAALGVGIALLLGVVLAGFVRPLLFDTRSSDLASLAIPSACVLFCAAMCSFPAALRAIRLAPADCLREE